MILPQVFIILRNLLILFTLLYFTLFTLLYFTLLYFTLLYFTLLYFTLLYFIPFINSPQSTERSEVYGL